MPDGQGYLKFDNFPVLQGRTFKISFDGHTILGSLQNWRWLRPPSVVTLRTHGGTSIEQLIFRGPDMPLNMEPFQASFTILVKFEEDARRLQFAMSQGLPVDGQFQFPIADVWSIKAAGSGNVNWRTSRKTIWDNVTETHTTHPPKAFIDSTAQTIVTSSPSAGQVQVPLSQTPDFQFETIVTPVLSTGNFLRFFYWPELLVKFVGEATNIAVTNGWFFNVSIVDFPAGDYALP